MSTDRDVWKTLGLDPPGGGARYDVRAVKKAYAKALKTIDQSADPAGFQALRQAYEHGLKLAKAAKAEGGWQRFASDIGAGPSDITRIQDAINNDVSGIYREGQIALDTLGDLEYVAVLDQSAVADDACFVLNSLLVKAGGNAVPDELLAQIEEYGEAIWNTPIDVIETAVEYVAARFSMIAAAQNRILLSIHDEGENLMFAIAAKNVGQAWIGEKLGSDIEVYGVNPVPEIGDGDLFRPADAEAGGGTSPAPIAGTTDLFHGDGPLRTIDIGARYAAYAQSVDAAMETDTENDWARLLDDLGDEPSELREDVEAMIFRTLLDAYRAGDGAQALPTSITAEIVEELDEQFQWLSDSVGFQRKFLQNADVMIVALNEARGRKTKFQKILRQPYWLIVSAMVVVMYAVMRAFITWLTSIGMIS